MAALKVGLIGELYYVPQEKGGPRLEIRQPSGLIIVILPVPPEWWDSLKEATADNKQPSVILEIFDREL